MSRNFSADSGFVADISRIINYAPAKLIGRENETRLLNDAWTKVCKRKTGRCHVLTFVAFGGEGKTSLVTRWAAALADKDWPGCDAAFAWSFYRQGTGEQAVSSDLFLKEALSFFGDVAMANSAQAAYDKGRRLAQIVGERQALLILDGLEPLQYAPTSPTPGELKDQGLSALLKGLAAISHGLCVVTTRYAIPDLRAFVGKTVREVKLTRISKETGVALLKTLGVKGTPPAFEKLVEQVQGHALTLNLLGSYLRDAHAGDIRRHDLVKLEEADAEEQGGHAFRVMDAYVQAFESGGHTDEGKIKGRRALALLELMGLFDRPATIDCLNAFWKGEVIAGLTEPLFTREEKLFGLKHTYRPVIETQRNMSLTRLEDANLLIVNRDEASGLLVDLDVHPLIREYFARRVRRQKHAAWRSAQRRLYEHLCATTKEGDQPTLEDLQPLYQAVVHGCEAGLPEEALNEVYRNRVQRWDENYTSRKLGALGSELGAIACFFETQWSRVSPALSESAEAWLLNEAAYCLRALGRSAEALEPMQASLEGYKKQRHWRRAAIVLSHLAHLEVTLGEVAAAVADAAQSVTYADRSGDAEWKIATRTAHADALHQAGKRVEAGVLFREAEEIQAESLPAYPLLCCLQGFEYSDLLLTEAEHAAWRGEGTTRKDQMLEACLAVSERGARTLKWMQQAPESSPLDIAYARLTICRARLYATLLERGTDSLQPLRPEFDSVVADLRRAGTMDMLPRGLLTRAWLRFLTAARTGLESAQSDLDEAWEIAERGPMPLFLADILLHRARLFFRETLYPWDQNSDDTPRGPEDDLAAARRLIEKHGYWRRKEELEAAEQASQHW